MKFAFPTDEHHPYQDDKAVEVAMKVVNDFDPDLLVIGSDGIDFYLFSRFDHNPARKSTIQEDINSWKHTQRAWIDAAPRAARQWIPGNHEDRWRKYVWQHPELSGIDGLSYTKMLELDDLDALYDTDEIVLNDTVVVKHGAYIRKFSAYSAKAELENERYSISTITGHSHRGGSHFARTRTGIVQAHEGFCLCNLEPEYALHPDWQQGILLGEIQNGVLNVEPVVILDKQGKKVAYWRGKEYAV